MSLRNMTVQYVGDTLYLPPLERKVKHIVVREADVKDWMNYEEIVRCEDCKFFDTQKCKSYWSFRFDGFCAWGVRRDA